MCGFYGFLRRGDADNRRDVSAMADAVAARGPDDAGEIELGPLTLGHRRLAILDLGATGRQPFLSRDGRLAAAVNGEIYNHEKLLHGDDLAPEGTSDARAVFPAWRLERELFPQKLHGMFAAALFDELSGKLILARDRLGQKPLFWAEVPDGVVFASTLPAVMSQLAARVVDPSGAAGALIHHATPAPQTAVADVRAVPPGHVVVFGAEGGFEQRRYWEPDTRHSHGVKSPLDLLDEAVRDRLQADVPVGVLLSGGLDSAAVLESVHRQTGERVPVFTMGFDDPKLDERALAQEVASALGGEAHVDVFADPGLADVERLIEATGEPLTDASALPFSRLCAAAASTVKVALTGDGGDELLGGYDRHRAVPAASRPAAALLLRLMSPFFGARRRAKIRRLAGGSETTLARRLLLTQAVASAPRIEDLLAHRAVAIRLGVDRERYDQLAERYDAFSDMQRTILLDRETNLPADLLVKADRGSMAHGLEVRSPFLDHRLHESATAAMAADPRWPPLGKRPLRERLRGRVPARVLRARKRGFGTPLERWLKDGALGSDILDLLTSQRCRERGMIVPGEPERLMDDVRRGLGLAAEALYGLAVLELWVDAFGVRFPAGRPSIDP